MKTKVFLGTLALVCIAVCGCAGFLPKEGYLLNSYPKENLFVFYFSDEIAATHGGLGGEGVKKLLRLEIQKIGICPSGYSLDGPYAYKGRNRYHGRCNLE